jgi:DNA-directed RNA polymerase specialized sigma24 family protein
VLKRKKKIRPPGPPERQGDSIAKDSGSTSHAQTESVSDSTKKKRAQPQRPSQRWEENYGDFIYDLFRSILWNSKGADTLYLSFWNQMDRELSQSTQTYERHARAWVVSAAVKTLLAGAPKLGRTLTASEQVMLDAHLNVPARLRQFESYLHKLGVSDQILLLLRDKYGLPYSDIAPAMGYSEGALKIKRQQALRAMEEWLWDRT